jgi:crotonobetainyl-CoA:carnitine CoA-transferase CaiB-like acyl-CoA transferase
VFADPQVLHRKMAVKAPHPKAGEVTMVANPIKFSATPITHDRAPPLLGEHTDEILQSVLGMGEEELRALRQKKII